MTVHPLESAERNRIRIYFADARLPYALTFLVLGLVLVELTLGKLLLFLGLSWLAAALVLAAQRPSEEELDRLTARDLGALAERAARSLDRPDDEIQVPPLALLSPSPLAPAALDRRFLRPRTGRDGRLRSPVNRAVVLVPMEDQLGTWSCDLSSLTGQIANIAIAEHHYRDIVSVRMEQDVAPASGPGAGAGAAASSGRAARPPTQLLTLELTSGARVAVPFVAAWQRGERENALASTELEKTLAAIRALLRDKR